MVFKINEKLLILILFTFTFISCVSKKSEYILNSVSIDSPKSFSILGYCVVAPQNSLNVKYSIVNKSIAEVSFDYNNINYFYRASQNLDELLLFYDNLNYYKKYVDNESNIEITIQTNNKKEYIVYWNINDVYYSLFGKNEKDINDLSLILIINKVFK